MVSLTVLKSKQNKLDLIQEPPLPGHEPGIVPQYPLHQHILLLQPPLHIPSDLEPQLLCPFLSFSDACL